MATCGSRVCRNPQGRRTVLTSSKSIATGICSHCRRAQGGSESGDDDGAGPGHGHHLAGRLVLGLEPPAERPAEPDLPTERFVTADSAVEVLVAEDTVLLSQQALADLFGVDRTSISKHIQNIFSEGELTESDVTRGVTQQVRQGQRTIRREVVHYDLDAIISVGYRVNSKRGVEFRRWATGVLKERLRKASRIDEGTPFAVRSLGHALAASIRESGDLDSTSIRAFNNAWLTLYRYDSGEFPDVEAATHPVDCVLSEEKVRRIVATFRRDLEQTWAATPLL